jgi:hypothetical protein
MKLEGAEAIGQLQDLADTIKYNVELPPSEIEQNQSKNLKEVAFVR